MPPHRHYVEPFAGGLAVLLAKDPEGSSEVADHWHGDLTTFWKVLRDPALFAAFARLGEATAANRGDAGLAAPAPLVAGLAAPRHRLTDAARRLGSRRGRARSVPVCRRTAGSSPREAMPLKPW
jgi:hypothetical protein